MAEINKISIFSDVSGNSKKALVDSQRRIVISDKNSEIISGIVEAVPGGVETTIVSYTVPSGKKFKLCSWSGSGTADAKFILYINGAKKMTLRNSVAFPNVNKEFVNPIEVLSGITIAIKVWHSEVSTEEFSALIEGYLE